MALNFRYKAVNRPDGTISRTPSVPVTLIGKEIFETVGLLDSGADISAIPKHVAEILGLDLNKEITYAYGIGGKVKAIETVMEILIQQGHEKYRFNLPVKVILDDYDFPVLLGRAGFFDEFIIRFDQENQKISLIKKSKAF